MADIVTCCNDARLPDLRQLVNSVRHYAPEARIRVIPFDDDIAETTAFAESIGARVMTRNPLWDDLGRRLFGDELYRPGLPSWKYFRKLNMFEEVRGPTLFLDANAVLLSSEIFPDFNRCEIAFHSGAFKGRNFSPAGAFVQEISPGIGNGYNLGHCAFGPEAAEAVRRFAGILPGFHRRFLGPAPEQAFLCYALAFMGVRVKQYHDLDPDIAPHNSAIHLAGFDASGAVRYTRGRFAGLRLISMKRTGEPNSPVLNAHLFAQFE